MDEVFPLEDGVGLNVVRSGAPDAPVTVVLAHGYALDHRSWFRVVPELAHDELQVVAYDHRGHGQSGPATPETATIERLGDDLAELIERGVDSERVVVVGHSMGGMAAMALVERHPRLFGQRVAGLGFLSTAVGRRGETSLAWPQAVGFAYILRLREVSLVIIYLAFSISSTSWLVGFCDSWPSINSS